MNSNPRAQVDRRSTPGPDRGPTPIATTWRSYVAELPAWLIVAGALAVSFWTQVQTVNAHGFARWEALVWGASTDAGVVAFLFLAREGAHRGTPTWGAWLGSITCSFMSVQYNTVTAVQTGDWLAVEAHLWMPALALGTWYWMLHGRHRRWNLTLSRRIRRLIPELAVEEALPESPDGVSRKFTPSRKSIPEPEASRKSVSNPQPSRNGRPTAHQPPPDLDDVIAGMMSRGVPVTVSNLAEELGVGRATAGRYLQQQRAIPQGRP